MDRTIRTASRNLIEGGLVVMAVLFLFLFQIRAGLIVSSAIPLAMLGAIIGMSWVEHFRARNAGLRFVKQAWKCDGPVRWARS